MKIKFLMLTVIGMATACAPKIYVIDRQTVFEQESAGDWPQFEKQLTEKSVARGPTDFGLIPMTQKKAKLYKVLNGELIAQPSQVDKK